MLEKLLPIQKNLNEQPQNPDSSPEESNTSPNLLESFKDDFFESYSFVNKATLILKLFILILPGVFFFMLALNDALDRKIMALEDDKNVLTDELFVYPDVQAIHTSVVLREQILKQVNEKEHYAPAMLDSIIKSLPEGVSIKNEMVQGKTASLILLSPGPLNVASFITNVLKDDFAQEVSILSANLVMTQNIYEIELVVRYR